MRIRLNTDNVQKLPIPDKNRIEYKDTKYKSLSLRVSSTGNKSWLVTVYEKGKCKKITLGRFPYVSSNEAERLADLQESKLAVNIKPGAEKTLLEISRLKDSQKIKKLDFLQIINGMRALVDDIESNYKRLSEYFKNTETKLWKNLIKTGLKDGSLINEGQIIAGSYPKNQVVLLGVYFLIKNNSVVYVGQSVNIFARINSHFSTKDFNSFSFIQCKKTDLDKLESLYIHYLKPPQNATYKNGNKKSPLSVIQLKQK